MQLHDAQLHKTVDISTSSVLKLRDKMRQMMKSIIVDDDKSFYAKMTNILIKHNYRLVLEAASAEGS